MKMYFEEPATEFEETLPIGNGHLGGIIFGDVKEETIGLNDCFLWSGYPYDKNNLEAHEYLKEIRQEILAGNNPKAEAIASRFFTGNYSESYLPLGNLKITENQEADDVVNYQRKLNISDSLVEISFDKKDTHYKREYFTSYPGKGIYGKYENTQPTNYTFSFESQLFSEVVFKKNGLEIFIQAPEHVDPNYLFDAKNPVIQGNRGEKHYYLIEILNTDGKIQKNELGFSIENCRIFTFVFHRLDEKIESDYQKAKENHLKDYHPLFQRVDLDLGEQTELPLKKRLENLRQGKEDPALYALYFQYNRYLLISSSRKGGLPANLQGIWNWHLRAPWSSNYTVNINLEMNYWSADMLNLSECFAPYAEFVKKVSQNGKETAKAHYNMNGSVVHHNTDKWGMSNPVGRRYQEKMGDEETSSWSMWNMSGCWMAADLYRHYTYTQDKKFLKETVYPVLKENILFLLDYLVEIDGTYHSLPSTSPENTFYNEKEEVSALTYSSTMDLCLIKENFLDYLNTCELLEIPVTSKEIKAVERRLQYLAQIKIGSQGQILEWQKEYREVEPGHRHVSHLYGLFPGNLYQSEELKQAALRSLELRMANGGGYTGWSNAWVANLFAKLGEGKKVYERLYTALTKASYPNLWSKHPPFQIDGNLGIGSAYIQMFAQVDEIGEVKWLPALPKEFAKKGSLKGACLPGGKVVSVWWEDGKVMDFRITEK